MADGGGVLGVNALRVGDEFHYVATTANEDRPPYDWQTKSAYRAMFRNLGPELQEALYEFVKHEKKPHPELEYELRCAGWTAPVIREIVKEAVLEEVSDSKKRVPELNAAVA